MKKLDVFWINPNYIPKPPKRESNLDLTCHNVRKKDIYFISECLGLTYNPKFSDSSHGWIWVRSGNVEEHTDSDKYCVLVCVSGCGILHYCEKSYPLCSGAYLIFDSSQLHSYTMLSKSVFLVVPVKEKKITDINQTWYTFQ